MKASSICDKIEIFVLSNKRFYKLSNDTKIVQIDMILLQSVYFLLLSLYFTYYFQNKLGRQDAYFVVMSHL